MTLASPRRFSAIVHARPRGGISVTLPFDPSTVWGALDAFHVRGSLGGQPYRGSLTADGHEWRLELGPSWCRNPGFRVGDEVECVMGPEGPRSTTIGADVAEAFESEAGAKRFFDSLPTFYRNNYTRWIESAKRPETRARRVAEMIALLKDGRRER